MNLYTASYPSLTAYLSTIQYTVQFNAPNTGPAELQFNALAAVQIVKPGATGNVPLAGGEIGAGATMNLTYDATGYEGGPAFVLGASVPVIPDHSLGAQQMAGDANANLVADSGFQLGSSYWDFSGAGAIAIAQGAGGGGQNALELAGTGAASGNLEVVSAAIPVIPGQSYVLSAYIDSRFVSSGTPAWLLMSVDRTTTYASVEVGAGALGRTPGAAVTIPAGVASVVVVFVTQNCTVESGEKLLASAPQLEVGATVTQYKSQPVGAAFSLDNLPDGSTYARMVAAALLGGKLANFLAGVQGGTAFPASPATGAVFFRSDTNRFFLYDGSAWIQVSLASLDELADGATYGRTLLSRLSAGVPYTFLGAWSSTTAYSVGDEVVSGGNYYICIAANTNSAPPSANWQLEGPDSLDNVSDGTTYQRMPVANMDSNRRGLIDFSQSGHLNKILDEIADGSTYGRTLLTALTSGQVDLSRAGVINKTLDNIADGVARAAQLKFSLPNVGSAQWVHLGTWVFAGEPSQFKAELVAGGGYNSGGAQQGTCLLYVRTANGGTAPNISGASYFGFGGGTLIGGFKVVATGSSTSATNTSWELYIYQEGATGGIVLVDLQEGDTFTYSGATGQTDPGAASSTVVVGTGG